MLTVKSCFLLVSAALGEEEKNFDESQKRSRTKMFDMKERKRKNTFSSLAQFAHSHFFILFVALSAFPVQCEFMLLSFVQCNAYNDLICLN